MYFESFWVIHLGNKEKSHRCLVYEPMREPFWLYQGRFVDEKKPLPLIKAYLIGILSGLDYLYSICKVAHGGKSLF